MSSVVDDCNPPARETVWRQLFVLSGMPKGLKSSKPFLPVVNNWMRGSTMNLLAIELLYLAFATALNQYPDFIKNNLTTKHRELAAALESTPNSQPLTSTAAAKSISRFDERSIHSNMDAVRGFRSSEVPNVAQQPLPNFSACFGQPTSHSKPVETDLDIFKKLIQLQSWKAALDAQPPEVRGHIWGIFKQCDDSQRVDFNSFANTINVWAQDIVPNMNSISHLHGIVAQLFAQPTPTPPQPSHDTVHSQLPSFLSRNQPNLAAPSPTKSFPFSSGPLGHTQFSGDPPKRPLEHTFVDESQSHSKKRMKTNFMDS